LKTTYNSITVYCNEFFYIILGLISAKIRQSIRYKQMKLVNLPIFNKVEKAFKKNTKIARSWKGSDMTKDRRKHISGFSLLELVIAVMIIAIIAAIGIPRLSRGTRGAADSALSGSLALLRNAIDIYAAEHLNTYPTEANITNQLTQYTDHQGATSATKTTTHIYGPYIRNIPPLPVGARKSGTLIATADANDVGWIYDDADGSIRANTTTEQDDTGKLYSDY
jgi:prepilin-type N-terminal cleavage/methylation domain-containing protein